jgi:hypothetical protein
MRAIGIAIPFIRRRSGAAIDAQAQAHYNRVIADGGVVPSGLSGVNAFFIAVKAIYGTSDITTAISVGLDAQVLGYKLGAGAGTTLGQAAQKLYSCSGASGDVVQTTAASQPLLLAHEGANYWWNGGVNGNYCSTPSSAANSIVGDIEFTAYIDYKNNGTLQIIHSKSLAVTNFCYDTYIDSANKLVLQYSLNGISALSGTCSVSLGSTYIGWVKINRISSTGVIKFYTSTDGITYTQLGGDISGTSGNIFNSTASLAIGAYRNGFDIPFSGKIYRATISNSIGGAPVVDFNPNQYNAATSQTQWTSSTGEVWTINTGTAATGYKGVLVDRTIVQGDGVDDGLVTSATINLGSVFTLYGAFKGYNNEGGSGKIVFGKQNIDGAFTRFSSINLGAWFGALGAALIQQAATVNNLNLGTFKRKLSDNTFQVNNGAIATNANSVVLTNSEISVFSATAYGICNGLFNTGVFSIIEDNTTQKTNMYNYIRSINNSAF